MIAGNNAFSLVPGQSGHVVVIKPHKGNFYLLFQAEFAELFDKCLAVGTGQS